MLDTSLLKNLGVNIPSRDWYQWLRKNGANNLLPEDLAGHYNLLCYARTCLLRKQHETVIQILRYLISQIEKPGADDRLLLSTRLFLAETFCQKRQFNEAIQELRIVINILDTSSEGHQKNLLVFYWFRSGRFIRNRAFFGTSYLTFKRANNDFLHEMSILTHTFLAIVYETSDQEERARAHFDRAFSEIRGDEGNLEGIILCITTLEIRQAEIDYNAERFDAAERLLERANKRAGRHYDRNHELQTEILDMLACVMLEKGYDIKEIKALVTGNRIMEAQIKASEEGSFLNFY